MNLSLYQLSSHYLQALETLTDPDVDLPLVVINDTLESLSGELEDKAINVTKFLRNLETTAEAIKTAEVAMSKRRKALESRVQSLKDYLKSNMEATGITQIECPYFKLSIAKNPAALDLYDSEAIPSAYKSYETVTIEHIDKAAIKTALMQGQDIAGAKLTHGTRLAIR